MPLPMRATVHADASNVPPTPVNGEYAGQSGDDMRAHDARSMQAALERSLQEAPGASEAAEAQTEAPASKPAEGRSDGAPHHQDCARPRAGGTLGWGPLRAMLATTSVEALVNARVETIRSPIEGLSRPRRTSAATGTLSASRRGCASSTRSPIIRASTICGVSIRRSNPSRACSRANPSWRTPR